MRLIALASLLILAGCRTTAAPVVASASAPATVDGDAGEWAGGLRPVPGEPGLSVGVRNTGDALAVVVVAGAEWQARRVATGGLTLWLDPAGGTSRRVGLRFPLGVGGPPVVRDSEAEGVRIDDGPLRQAFAAAPERLAVVRGGTAQPVAVGGVAGVETAATWTASGLVVEARLPLRGAAAQAFAGEAAGARVGLGLELAGLGGRTGPQAPSLTGRSPTGRADYGADQSGNETAAPQTVTAAAPRSATTWLAVALAP